MLFFLQTLSRLPLWALYGIADVLFIVAFYLFRWRRDIAEGNLRRAFPEKSSEEINAIARQNYRNMGMVLAEGIWGARATAADMRSRIIIENPEALDPYIARGQSPLLMAAHFCNWEWMIFTAGLYLSAPVVGVYKPQHVQGADIFLKRMRTHLGGTLIPHKDFAREVVRRRKQVFIYALIADQTPLKSEKKHWSFFLNQDTAFFVGSDRLARIIKAPVFFISAKRLRRGHYALRFEQIGDPPYDAHQESAIIENYVRCLERDIRNSPENWLWVHKKWKYKKPPDGNESCKTKQG
ncbi:MAG: lysophospholipid acyltransferase family protein [Burkholderiales bacterium]|nr:lysophospholipid acyltransferase family protein [Burkholderiales bacterium]